MAKKRMYYSPGSTGNIEKVKIFLLRFQDPVSDVISNEGPFKNEDEATDKLSSFLKKGICSWLVTYYD